MYTVSENHKGKANTQLFRFPRYHSKLLRCVDYIHCCSVQSHDVLTICFPILPILLSTVFVRC